MQLSDMYESLKILCSLGTRTDIICVVYKNNVYVYLQVTPFNLKRKKVWNHVYDLFQRPDLVSLHSHTLLVACVYTCMLFQLSAHYLFSYCIPHKQLAVCKFTRPLFCEIEGETK